MGFDTHGQSFSGALIRLLRGKANNFQRPFLHILKLHVGEEKLLSHVDLQ